LIQVFSRSDSDTVESKDLSLTVTIRFRLVSILNLSLNLIVAETAMGKPFSKASEGGDFEVLGEREDFTESEIQHGSEKHVLICSKVRPEAFPTGSPTSVLGFLPQC